MAPDTATITKETHDMGNSAWIMLIHLETLLTQPLIMNPFTMIALHLEPTEAPMTLPQWHQYFRSVSGPMAFPTLEEQWQHWGRLAFLSELLVSAKPLPHGLIWIEQTARSWPVTNDVERFTADPAVFPRFHHTPDPTIGMTESEDDLQQSIRIDVLSEAYRQQQVLHPYGPQAAALMIPGCEFFSRDEIPLIQAVYEANPESFALYDGDWSAAPGPLEQIFAYDQPYDLMAIIYDI